MPMTNHPSRQLPISVITGFLGAGKTTLLGRLLRQPGFGRTAVVINEFGEVPLDHELVEAASEDIVEVSGGCLCCTVRGDLSRAIRQLDLHRRRGRGPDFDRLLIETTGLADPAPILHTLMTDPMIADGHRLDGVITLVDAVAGLATLDRHPEAVKQVAMAERVLVTKTDLTGDRVQDALQARLAALAPTAVVTPVAHGQVDPSCLFDLGPWRTRERTADVERWLGEVALKTVPAHGDHHHAHYEHDHRHEHGGADHHHDPNRHDDCIRAFCLRRPQPIAAGSLALFLKLLGATAGPDLLRVKGIVKLADEPDRPLVLHQVQHIFHEPVQLDRWPSTDRDTRIVYIVRDIKERAVAKLFDALAAAG